MNFHRNSFDNNRFSLEIVWSFIVPMVFNTSYSCIYMLLWLWFINEIEYDCWGISYPTNWNCIILMASSRDLHVGWSWCSKRWCKIFNVAWYVWHVALFNWNHTSMVSKYFNSCQQKLVTIELKCSILTLMIKSFPKKYGPMLSPTHSSELFEIH